MYKSAHDALDSNQLPHMPLLRCPATGKIKGVITTHQIVQLWTHHTRGRTVGCSSPFCPDCDSSVPTRYEAYVGLYGIATKKHAIFAMTLAAVRQILDQVGRIDRLRGLVVEFGRSSKRTNSKVLVQATLMYPDTSSLPAPVDLIQHLERIWGPERKRELEAFREKMEAMSPAERQAKKWDQKALQSQRWTIVESTPLRDADDQLHFPGNS